MQVYLGIDWSENKHDIVFMNEAGASIAQLTIEHSPEGFHKLDWTRQKLGLERDECVLGLETSHNLLIDFLWDRGYEHVYVVPPAVVKGSRSRYRQSGARTDPSDAHLVADILRTDQGRLQPWHPDSLLTRQIRARVSLIHHLTPNITRLSNRLRAVLLRYYPAALNVFSELSRPITLHFLKACPAPEAAAALTLQAFEAFARLHRYPRPGNLRRRFALLNAPQPQPSQDTVLVYQDEVPLVADLLLALVQAKKTALKQLSTLFRQHPDHEVFSSLPGAGPFLAPALLSKFGDDRRRFPDRSSIQALAGTCPVTDASGKRKRVRFRYACDREFRTIVQQWARCSLRMSVWANGYYDRVRPHCSSESHAYRCLGNRWLAVAWALWQKREPYDEAYHLRHSALRRRPKHG
jgi:transposase